MSLHTTVFPILMVLIASCNCQDVSAQVKDLADVNTDFGLDLYKQIIEDSENTFLSPYSISVALGMLYRGADGNTKDEVMTQILFSAQLKQ